MNDPLSNNIPDLFAPPCASDANVSNHVSRRTSETGRAICRTINAAQFNPHDLKELFGDIDLHSQKREWEHRCEDTIV